MKVANLRWWVAGLLVTASLLNYVDRTALGVASKNITDELRLSEAQYGLIVSAFLVAYTLSYGLGGILVDRLGTRASVALTLSWWSLANMAHALARGLHDLMAYRFLLGLGEATFYPAAMRGISEWFRPADRSKPIGMILAGASLGAVLAAPIVGTLMATPGLGWRSAFLFTGGLGFVVLPAWLFLYRHPREHPFLTDPERKYLAADGEQGARRAAWPMRYLLSRRQTWVLILSRALTDASWYLLLFWLFRYFQKARGFTDAMVAQTNWIPFATADLGALAGGWIAAGLIRRGMSTTSARRLIVFVGTWTLPVALLGYSMPADAPYAALALCSVATFAHMAYGANHLSLHADLFPSHSVATVMGLSGAAGSLGGVIAGSIVGPLVDQTQSYLPVFLTTALLHPLAGLILVLGLGSAEPLSGPAAEA